MELPIPQFGPLVDQNLFDLLLDDCNNGIITFRNAKAHTIVTELVGENTLKLNEIYQPEEELVLATATVQTTPALPGKPFLPYSTWHADVGNQYPEILVADIQPPEVLSGTIMANPSLSEGTKHPDDPAVYPDNFIRWVNFLTKEELETKGLSIYQGKSFQPLIQDKHLIHRSPKNKAPELVFRSLLTGIFLPKSLFEHYSTS
ncbi:MAG: hypothetical protein WCJ24_01900 [Candidatus Saccharibacteria bacterium]